ncbi:hypothetical protein [Rhodopseudomonas palustris]|uniref:hypothetical protein n=1 Tax=Rhodopseudomonas palustris TaxID=1076 RepID=UPI0021F344F5|nr:hypothetical protein [Rhodopseudomonas palustris]
MSLQLLGRNAPVRLSIRSKLALCAEDGIEQPSEVAHTLALVIDGAIVMALVTRGASAADVAGRACAAVLPA